VTQTELPSTDSALGTRPTTLYVLVGLPGSGKTTYARRALRRCLRVSLDDLRVMLSGKAFEARLEPLVAEIGSDALEQALVWAVSAGLDVVFDATNVTRRLRARSLALAAKHGVRPVAVWLRCQPADARARNRARKRVVPDEAMDRFEASFEPPTVVEGFAQVLVVDCRG
jgi:predicted kinase